MQQDPQTFLAGFYQNQKAETQEDKIKALTNAIQGKCFSFHSVGAELTEAGKLKILEREFLIEHGQIEPNLC